jgi:excinuclease ABC subunit C
MCQLSKESKFEEAGKIRDRIYNLQQVMSHTHVINNGSEHGNENSFTHKFDDRHFYEKGNGWDKTEKKLQEILWQSLRGAEATKQSINRIECYDVSNIQGKFATGSMVVFINGAPDKNLYRKFKIKMENEPNDIAMLKETLQRRFLHPEWPFPDAILIDGGKAQLNVALKIVNSLKIENLKLKISVMSIAKGKQELFIEGRNQPIPLKSLPQEIYNLVKQLDDEAHRFAIAYHKKLRKKSLLQ